jgi:guanylate kinase
VAARPTTPTPSCGRFNEASRELLRAHEFDYLVFNEVARMETAIDEIVAIITAERLKTAQQPVRI